MFNSFDAYKTKVMEHRNAQRRLPALRRQLMVAPPNLKPAIARQISALSRIKNPKLERATFTISHGAPYSNTPAHASSSWQMVIDSMPSGTTSVSFGGKRYVYSVPRSIIENWLKSNSLGRFYNNRIKR